MSPHFETELELAERYMAEGKRVVFVHCHGGFKKACSESRYGSSRCSSCKTQFWKGIRLLSHYPEVVPLPTLGFHSELPSFDSLASLKAYTYQGIDIGFSVFSSLVSWLREPEFNVNAYASELHDIIMEMQQLIHGARIILEQIKPSKVYVFQGRWALYRPLYQLTKQMGLPCMVHERTGQLQRFIQLQDHTPHDLISARNRMIALSSQYPVSSHRMEFESWFIERRSGKNQGWWSFVSAQSDRDWPRLPKDKTIVAIFISSEDEFVAFDDWQNQLFESQNDGIDQLLSAFSKKDAYHFVIRVHPNLKMDCPNTQLKGLLKIAKKHPHTTLIPAHSKVSSYRLLDASSVVITFGSTVGVEATYWGKPSINGGGATIYETLDVTYNATSLDELIQWIRIPPPPKPQENAIQYAAFELYSGEPFRYYYGITPGNGYFKGVLMNA